MATAAPISPGAATTRASVLIPDVSWAEYEALLDWIGDRPVRVNYDRGNLEIMSPSLEHEWQKSLLSRFVGMLALELSLPIKSSGSTTFRRELRQGGLEPDDSFWFRNEPCVRGKTTWSPEDDPPPDLALEIEVSRGVLDRLDILSGLGVPELWAFDGTQLRILHRQPSGRYEQGENSLCLPQVPIHRLVHFLQLGQSRGELEAMQAFVAWIRAGFPEP